MPPAVTLPEPFASRTHAHEWTAGELAGAALEMDHLADGRVRWTRANGRSKGESMYEKEYRHVRLPPQDGWLSRITWLPGRARHAPEDAGLPVIP